MPMKLCLPALALLAASLLLAPGVSQNTALWTALPTRSSQFDVIIQSQKPAGLQLSLSRRVIGFTRAEDGSYYQAEQEGILRPTDLAVAVNHHSLQFFDDSQVTHVLSAGSATNSLKVLGFTPANPTEHRLAAVSNTDYDIQVDASQGLLVTLNNELRVTAFTEDFQSCPHAGLIALGDRVIGIDNISLLTLPPWRGKELLRRHFGGTSEILCRGRSGTGADDYVHCRQQTAAGSSASHVLRFRRAEANLQGLLSPDTPMTLEDQALYGDIQPSWRLQEVNDHGNVTHHQREGEAQGSHHTTSSPNSTEHGRENTTPREGSQTGHSGPGRGTADASTHLTVSQSLKERWPPWAYAFTGRRGVLVARGLASASLEDYVAVDFEAAYFGVPYPRSRAPLLLADPPDACAALTEYDWAGSVILVRRGSCTFHHKARILQDVDALAMLVYNVDGSPPIRMQASPEEDLRLDLCAGMISASSATKLLRLLAQQDKGSVRVRFFPPSHEDVTGWIGQGTGPADAEKEKKVLLRVPTSAWDGGAWEDSAGRVRYDRPQREESSDSRSERSSDSHGHGAAAATAVHAAAAPGEATREETSEGANALLQSILSKKKQDER